MNKSNSVPQINGPFQYLSAHCFGFQSLQTLTYILCHHAQALTKLPSLTVQHQTADRQSLLLAVENSGEV